MRCPSQMTSSNIIFSLGTSITPWLMCLMLAGCGPGNTTEGGQDQNQDGKADTGFTPQTPWLPQPPKDGNLRLSSFNIRNFPTPPAGNDRAPSPSYSLATDQDALLSVLEKLDFDLMAVEEIVDPVSFSALIDRLSSSTGRPYNVELSQGSGLGGQFLGFVFDQSKLTVLWTREHEEINTTQTLRPGFSGRFQSQKQGGVDFTAMVLHLASGDSGKRLDLRAQQAAAASSIIAAQMQELSDPDYVVLGDFNTAKGTKEFPGLDAAFASGTDLTRLDNPQGCTAYYINNKNTTVRPTLLDQIYTGSLAERDTDVAITSGTHCFERACQPFVSISAETGGAYYSVSDHCPVYFEITDQDLD